MLLWLTTAFAIEPIAGADTVARGFVGAWPDDNAAVASSPGMIGLAKRYVVAGQGAIGPDLGWELSASAVDSRTSGVAMGVAYRARGSDPVPTSAELPGWIADGDEIENKRRSHDVALALAIPFGKRQVGEGEEAPPLFSFGLEGDLRLLQHARLGDHLAIDPGVGFAWRPTLALVLAASGTGLVPGGDAGSLPTVHGMVGAFDPKLGRVGVETAFAVGEAVAWSLRVGAEKAFDEKGAFRVGWHREGDTERQAFSIGGGLTSTAGDVDLALELPTNGQRTDEGTFDWLKRGFSIRLGVRLKV